MNLNYKKLGLWIMFLLLLLGSCTKATNQEIEIVEVEETNLIIEETNLIILQPEQCTTDNPCRIIKEKLVDKTEYDKAIQ